MSGIAAKSDGVNDSLADKRAQIDKLVRVRSAVRQTPTNIKRKCILRLLRGGRVLTSRADAARAVACE